MGKSALPFDIAERVCWTAAQAFLAAVVILPGGIWSSANWKVAAGAALIALVKGFAASRLTGDPGTAATLPASVTATGAVVGQVTGTIVSEAGDVVGEVTGTVGGVVDGVGDILDGDHSERGGVAAALAILVGCAIVLIAGFALCGDALFEDSDERNDLGAPAWVADNEPCSGEGACQGRQKKGCAEASAPCEDNDQTTVILCVHPDSCRFDGNKEET